MSGITIALSKGRIFDETLPLLAAAGIVPSDNPETSRKLIIGTNRPDVRIVIVRASDVPTYVQYGAADLGIAGKDVLLEHGGAGLYQPLDLEIAKCRMSVAVPQGFDYEQAVRRGARLRVATKYINTAREHFAGKGVHVDLIKLYGSMELAPLAGLAEAIVDLVSSGGTLKANNLVEVEQIMPISSRLIVNQASLKVKREQLQPVIDSFRRCGCQPQPGCRHEHYPQAVDARAGVPAHPRRVARLRFVAGRQHRAGGGRNSRRRVGPFRRCGSARIHAPLRPHERDEHGRTRTAEARVGGRRGLAARRAARGAGAGCSAGGDVPRAPACRLVGLHRGRRHAAGPEGHAARPRRTLRAGRQGGLSEFGADERDSGQGGRRRRTHHGGADAARRKERAGAGRGAHHRRRSHIHHRRRAGGRRAGLRHADHPAGRTRSPVPAMPTSRRPSAACSARSASTWWPGRPRC